MLEGERPREKLQEGKKWESETTRREGREADEAHVREASKPSACECTSVLKKIAPFVLPLPICSPGWQRVRLGALSLLQQAVASCLPASPPVVRELLGCSAIEKGARGSGGWRQGGFLDNARQIKRGFGTNPP